MLRPNKPILKEPRSPLAPKAIKESYKIKREEDSNAIMMKINNYTERLKDSPKSIYMVDKDGNHIVTMSNPDSTVTNNRQDTMTAKAVYDKLGYQWFAPGAEKYWPADSVNENILKNKNIPHFTSKNIYNFAKNNPDYFDYYSGNSGDWKTSKEGADGYLVSTVDEHPYWSDAIGQVPFATATFNKTKKIAKYPIDYIENDVNKVLSGIKNGVYKTMDFTKNIIPEKIETAINKTLSKIPEKINSNNISNNIAGKITTFAGYVEGSADLFNPNYDNTNNYDNKIIEKATNTIINTDKGDDTLSNFKSIFRYPVKRKKTTN